MSLSFKTTNINSSTKVLLSREQIDFVLKPVQITLVQPEEIVTATDTGPIIESVTPDSSQLDSGIGVLVSDNIPYIKETDEIDVVFTGDGGGRTGRGKITVGELTNSVVRDFENRTFGGGTTSTGPSGETVGTASPRGRLIIDRINPDGSTSDGFNSDGSSGPRGRV
jgi:hypothetical protein